MTTRLDDFDLDIRIGDRPAAGVTTPATVTFPTDPRACDPFTQECPDTDSCHRTVCC
ncbi:FDLD family class I lanthipeptide [Kutzneria chonburiensis]|uniref:FDLD family class I lanthipeptide n=1 Tax=Kutzneria chonburiensis TaxID=1483604 RepID=A0ABV6N766_9PSEU|nr:FDLD family class I lanthipeptide [Kutzneria chonburiensis]